MIVSQKTGCPYNGPTMPKYSGVKPTLAPMIAKRGKKPIQKIIEPGIEMYAYFVHRLKANMECR